MLGHNQQNESSKIHFKFIYGNGYFLLYIFSAIIEIFGAKLGRLQHFPLKFKNSWYFLTYCYFTENTAGNLDL